MFEELVVKVGYGPVVPLWLRSWLVPTIQVVGILHQTTHRMISAIHSLPGLSFPSLSSHRFCQLHAQTFTAAV